MASAFSIATGAVRNFQPTTSVLAGGAASIIICAIGAILVAFGVVIPPIGFLGLATATPLTMTMVMSAAVPIGHIVTSCVPDSVNQQLNGLAKKLQVAVQDIKVITPQVTYTYPTDKVDGISTGNLDKG